MSEDEENDVINNNVIRHVVEVKLKATNFKILDHRIVPLGERIGLLGDHALLDIRLEEDGVIGHVTFFIKYFPFLESPAEFAEGIGAFEKEMFIYDLFKEFKSAEVTMITGSVANCYQKKLNKYLILDNLIGENFKTLDKAVLLEYESVLVVLQSLAKIHASSLIYEEKMSKELGTNFRLSEKYDKEFEESFFSDRDGFINKKGVDASIRGIIREIDIFQFPDKLLSGKSFKNVAKTLCYRIYELVKPSKKFRNSLCHGDLWATNFLLKFDSRNRPVDCKFVDFQCGRYVPPAHDVLSFLYLTTSREFRKNYMYEVIGTYYSYLEKYLKIWGIQIKDIISFEQFMASCEEQKLFAVVQAAIYFPLILINNDSIEKYFSDKELNEKALFEDRSYLVLSHMDKDENYTRRIRETIEDLKEYCDYI